MAPAWVLLERPVNFVCRTEPIRGASKGNEFIGGARKGGAPPSRKEMADATEAFVLAMTPDPHIEDPPEVSSINMLQPIDAREGYWKLSGGFIASADKNLLVIYAGPYRPGSCSAGCYLIYDASKNSISTIPRVPAFDASYVNVGSTAVVLRHGGEEGAYVLAEFLERFGSTPPEADLCLWWSSGEWVQKAGSSGEWVRKAGRLPPEVCLPAHVFEADMSFSFGGSLLCWVDLKKGIVYCDVLEMLERGLDPKFRFIPLPEGCPTFDSNYEHQLRLDEFRFMGCVGGAIKFVTMDGLIEGWPANEVTLTTWTLSPDLREWKKSMVYRVGEIWANETYISMGLPQQVPIFPVLSMHEDDVVYLVLSNASFVKDHYVREQYVLRVDMRRNEVLAKYHPRETVVFEGLFASEFSAYLKMTAREE